jgi:hypothetical protein
VPTIKIWALHFLSNTAQNGRLRRIPSKLIAHRHLNCSGLVVVERIVKLARDLPSTIERPLASSFSKW